MFFSTVERFYSTVEQLPNLFIEQDLTVKKGILLRWELIELIVRRSSSEQNHMRNWNNYTRRCIEITGWKEVQNCVPAAVWTTVSYMCIGGVLREGKSKLFYWKLVQFWKLRADISLRTYYSWFWTVERLSTEIVCLLFFPFLRNAIYFNCFCSFLRPFRQDLFGFYLKIVVSVLETNIKLQT